MKSEIQEVGVDESGNPTVAFEYKGKSYMGICSEVPGED